MREIKFRAWDGERMYYDVQNAYDYFSCNESDRTKWGHDYPYDAKFSFQSFQNVLDEAKSVMQFTCLRDKNGKEIYEDDILQRTDEFQPKTGQVKWISESDGYDFTGWCFPGPMGSSCNGEKFEVIGNIHETPELVK